MCKLLKASSMQQCTAVHMVRFFHRNLTISRMSDSSHSFCFLVRWTYKRVSSWSPSLLRLTRSLLDNLSQFTQNTERPTSKLMFLVLRVFRIYANLLKANLGSLCSVLRENLRNLLPRKTRIGGCPYQKSLRQSKRQ